ncbi:TniQ family protein [Pseudaminobacter soli (ex Li et al. 2025)]|uniref:TniQ family protein n=1 Tax=Pseudaminobacter soli (ex Li et al. 2025) TaxID=1295366 RepID=UPI003D158356
MSGARPPPNSARLVIRRDPLPWESGLGWLLWLTEANGYNSPASIVSGGLTTDRDTFRTALSNATTVPVEDILDKFHSKRGHRDCVCLPAGRGAVWMTSRKRPKVCPACISAGLIPAVWDITLWAACPIHRCWMVRKCPQCGSEISWLRPGPDRCGAKGCDGRYSDAKKQGVSDQVAELMLLMGAAARLPGMPRPSALMEAFGALDLADILRLVALVAMPHEVLERTHRLASNRWLNTFDPEEVIDCAAGVLYDWPHNLHRFHARLRRTSSAPEDTTTKSTYPGLWRLTQGRGLSFCPESIRKILLPPLKALIDPLPGRRMRVAPFAERQQDSAPSWISTYDAAARLGLAPSALLLMARRQILRGEFCAHGSRTLLYLRAADVAKLLAEREPSAGKDRILSIVAAREFLGLGKGPFQVLTRRGIIQLTPYSIRSGNDLRPRFSLRPGIRQGGLEAIISLFEKASLSRSEGAVPLGRAVKSLSTHGVNMADVVELVRQGAIDPSVIDPSASNLRRFGLCVSDLKAAYWARCQTNAAPS